MTGGTGAGAWGGMAADLSGKAALITGAAAGIGRASALAFAAAGASVALLDIDGDGLADTAAAARACGARAEVLVADVTDMAAVAKAVGRAVEVFGGLHAAHNNAGVPGPYVPLDEYGEEDFLRVLQVGLVGVWRCMRAETGHMRAQGSGAIVNTVSVSTLALAATAGFLAFAGFESAGSLGEESLVPTRMIPRAIITAVAFGAVTYVACRGGRWRLKCSSAWPWSALSGWPGRRR